MDFVYFWDFLGICDDDSSHCYIDTKGPIDPIAVPVSTNFVQTCETHP
jgi:hypothetical protein